ncbi:MAG: trypsin-like peptidase domain-containing protein [Candidatus Pacebacteria bacterium]|nr:trypsin-like peptidase domain-containing protein [Candidatus Paceibacterota bacterium]
MNLYNLPNLKMPSIKKLIKSLEEKKNFKLSVFTFVVFALFWFLVGVLFITYIYYPIGNYLKNINLPLIGGVQRTSLESEVCISEEEAAVRAVKEVSPAVVSIIVSKDVPIVEEYFYNPFKEYEQFFGPSPFEYQIPQYRQIGTEKKEIGGASGVIISEDGIILTNKHVVSDEEAEYIVFTNDGSKYPAKVLARDPVQDLAVIKIEPEKQMDESGNAAVKSFPTARLGDSDSLEIGQTVITIGNALGEFRNTVSKGVVSGLGRTITASGGGIIETLEDVIQTDAAINKGNSGGPLVNLKGEVIGINTATVLEAQSIGFSIPINRAKRDIEQIKSLGKIVYPFLGVRYVLVNEKIKKDNNLSVDYGALIVKGDNGEKAVWPDSAAYKAGLKENDVILEVNGERITQENSLAKILMRYNPNDKISLKVLREADEMNIEVVLGERTE